MNTLLKLLNHAFERFFYRKTYRWRMQSKNCTIVYPVRYFAGEENITGNENLFLNKGIFLATFPTYAGYKYSPQITFGKNVYINFDCQITAINSILIGDDVLMGSNVTITDHLHGDPHVHDETPPKKRPLYSKGGVVIGANCLIGTGAVILPGVTLGEGCIVGANAVVTKSFPPYTVVAGNPAIAVRRIE